MNISEENFMLAEKLRNEDPEQFFTLVRMHLSFVLDLNTDDCDGNLDKKCRSLKWNLPFTKKPKSGLKNNNEGTILTSEFIAQIHPIIEFLSKEENITQEGIFRRSGRVTRQNELKEVLLQQGTVFNFSNSQFSVHECATVLKNILSELPESILTDAHYPAYCQIADLFNGKIPVNNERLLRSIQLLILLLPLENRKFFKEIIELLHLAVKHEDRNRMSADNLATLFTPHLLCPRRLSPEALHTNSQIMSRVVAFMIEKGSELFEIPPTVATDVRAYWNKKEKKLHNTVKQMNETLCDGSAANTVFTFVDRERTTQENETNPTETALAQLYAYIQCLPESSKKRKLIKQFNKENGYGTPLRAGGKKRTKTLNLGDSIKKHLSGFSKTSKKTMHSENAGGDNEINNSEPIFCMRKLPNEEEKHQKENFKMTKNPSLCKKPITSEAESFSSLNGDLIPQERSGGYKSLEEIRQPFNPLSEIDSFNQPGPRQLIFSENMEKITKKRNSSSPAKVSPCKSPRVSDERPVSPCAQEHRKWPVSNQYMSFDRKLEKINFSRNYYGSALNLSERHNQTFKRENFSVKDSFKTPRKAVSDLYLSDANEEVEYQFKTPIQKSNISNFVRSTNIDGFLSSPNNTNRFPILYGPKTSFLMTTSTPAPGNSCLLTPIVDKNNSMSPITKSTRRMPKAMQETMMTPRSRKPVISLSGTDLCNLANTNSTGTDCSLESEAKMTNKLILEDSNEEGENELLSSTFRNYLFSRSVLTTSPVDLSFSSRTDDFLSLSEKTSSKENENFKSLPEILNEAGLSESLLYCLDGNNPEFEENDSGLKANCSCSFSDSRDNLHHVYETAL